MLNGVGGMALVAYPAQPTASQPPRPGSLQELRQSAGSHDDGDGGGSDKEEDDLRPAASTAKKIKTKRVSAPPEDADMEEDGLASAVVSSTWNEVDELVVGTISLLSYNFILSCFIGSQVVSHACAPCPL